ncbi:DNA polymerase II large subunit [Candidatus Norongarragalina meridionalis]|nr:DNA polymerase II large subunit [Candidatus Norongarragalina meridionalis]
MRTYFDGIHAEVSRAYGVAASAREKMLDPEPHVEILEAPDLAARVEGLVGPEGVAARIREILKEKGKTAAPFEIAKDIMEGKYGAGDKERLMDQAVRTGLALFTEGVVSAPLEGVSRVRHLKNPDGSDYLALYFSGPIRGAGGTGQAFAVILGDYCRRFFGVAEFRPLEDEIERYVEELNLYAIRTRAGQYVPTEEEVRLIVRNCPVCIDGEPTEEYEISVHKNLQRVETNRVRGGMCLVMTEGICLKAPKVLKITKKAGLDWAWIEGLIKTTKQDSKRVEIKPNEKYMEELVGGRPIFAFPMRPGGFRLRYGRTPYCGIQSKAIHPASMSILDNFPVIGTQVKTERPGKGCIVTPCETIDGPIVLLNDGEVRRVETLDEADMLHGKVKEILFLGDMLVNYGDFLKSNHPLIPGAWCDEWFSKELEAAGVQKTAEELVSISWDDAVALAKKGASLAPRFTYYWHDVSADELHELAAAVCEGKAVYEWFDFKRALVPKKAKRLLERLGIPHKLDGEFAVLEGETGLAVLFTLGVLSERALSMKRFDAAFSDKEKDAMQLVCELSGMRVMRKAGTYIGASMGRPEKTRERRMEPPVHVLFPIGQLGGASRDIVRAVSALKNGSEHFIEADLSSHLCPSCGKRSWHAKCECGSATVALPQCAKCGRAVEGDTCSCGGRISLYSKQRVELPELYDAALKRVGMHHGDVAVLKGVIGLISEDKSPEPLEKGLLRARQDVSVFRDGTCRYDATEVPATHFVPCEVGITAAELRGLGYDVERDDETVELKAQDVILSKHASEYLMRVSKYVDDLLVYHYGLPPYYGAKQPEDMRGKHVIAIAPHTSAGIVARIIAFSDVKGIIAHPYLHCACRRNTDGDELCVMLLLDGLLNFSRHFLPSSRGGKMDAPLVLMTELDPAEVDDEVHAMDTCSEYPLSFYEASLRFASPSEAKLETVADRLGKQSQYEGIGFTHRGTLRAPVESHYVGKDMEDMRKKVQAELDLMLRIRAVDAQNAIERVILSHFLPDIYGNLRAFSKQKFRCVDCNARYRRVPLRGTCVKCGGKIILTISRGSVEKYLEISKQTAEKYDLPNYLRQRLMLLEKEIGSIFEDDKAKQFSLADYA